VFSFGIKAFQDHQLPRKGLCLPFGIPKGRKRRRSNPPGKLDFRVQEKMPDLMRKRHSITAVPCHGPPVDFRTNHNASRLNIGAGMDARAKVVGQRKRRVIVKHGQPKLDEPNDIETRLIAEGRDLTDDLGPTP
jgi:hypothetical protein